MGQDAGVVAVAGYETNEQEASAGQTQSLQHPSTPWLPVDQAAGCLTGGTPGIPELTLALSNTCRLASCQPTSLPLPPPPPCCPVSHPSQPLAFRTVTEAKYTISYGKEN